MRSTRRRGVRSTSCTRTADRLRDRRATPFPAGSGLGAGHCTDMRPGAGGQPAARHRGVPALRRRGRPRPRQLHPHGLLGYELLHEEGFPEVICRFASHHTGVGLSRDDVLTQRLPIPPADYLAESGEERLVMYADKFHSKTAPPLFRTAAACAARLRRFGDEKVRAFQTMRDTFGEPDLAPLSESYGHPIVGDAERVSRCDNASTERRAPDGRLRYRVMTDLPDGDPSQLGGRRCC